MRLFPKSFRPFVMALALIVSGSALVSCKQKTPEDRFEEAVKLLQEQQTPMAMLRLKDLISEHPDAEVAIDAHFMLANIYRQYGSEEYFKRAMEELQLVVDKVGLNDNRGLNAYSSIAEGMLALGQYDEALAHLEKGIETATEEISKTRLGMTVAVLKLNAPDDEREEEGIAYLREIMLTFEDKDARGQSREVLASHFGATERFQDAIDVYTEYMTKFPDDSVNPQLMIAQALNYQKMDDQEKAEEVMAKGVEGFQEQINDTLNKDEKLSLRRSLATYYAAFGDIDKAEAVHRKIMADHAMTMVAIQSQIEIGRLYLADEANWDRAIEHFEKMKTENPENEQITQAADGYIQQIAAFRAQKAEVEAEQASEVPSTDSES